MDFDFALALDIVQAVQVIDALTDTGRRGNHPILQMRSERGQFHTLYAELREDAGKFKNYTRMSVTAFDKLVGILRPRYAHLGGGAKNRCADAYSKCTPNKTY